ncbi:MAG: AIPR family protein [bacterium]
MLSNQKKAEEHIGFYRKFIDKIVEGTNTQTAINSVDLKSNDYVQVRLQRECRKLGYNYIRKKGISESRIPGPKIKKDYLSLALSSIKLDPAVCREGVPKLFGEHYKHIFNHDLETWFALLAYYFYKFIDDISKKEFADEPDKKISKYFVTHLLFFYLRDDLINNDYHLGKEFIDNCLKGTINNEIFKPLKEITKRCFNIAYDFYKKSIGDEGEFIKSESFFNRKGKIRDFKKFFEEKDEKYKNRSSEFFNKLIDNLKNSKLSKKNE